MKPVLYGRANEASLASKSVQYNTLLYFVDKVDSGACVPFSVPLLQEAGFKSCFYIPNPSLFLAPSLPTAAAHCLVLNCLGS